MPRYVAFLRGMNLGKRRITNPDLSAAFEALGLSEVSAFLASGNVVFSASDASPTHLATRIAVGLERQLQYPVPTYLRTADEVCAIAAFEPFPAAAAGSRGKPQVALLAETPAPETCAGALAMATPDDLLALGPRELHWLPSGSILDTALDLKALEGLLGGWTLRTRNTLVRLAAKLDASG